MTYHHGDLRAALIAAATAEIERIGYESLSLRELAVSLGVSRAAPYRHFAERRALLAALAAGGFNELAAIYRKAGVTVKTPQLRLAASGRAYLAFAAERPQLFRLMFGRFASSHYNSELREAGSAAFEALRQGAAQVLGLEAGDARVTVAAIRSWSLVHGLSQLMLDGQFEKHAENPEALVEAILRPEPSAAGKATAKKTGKK